MLLKRHLLPPCMSSFWPSQSPGNALCTGEEKTAALRPGELPSLRGMALDAPGKGDGDFVAAPYVPMDKKRPQRVGVSYSPYAVYTPNQVCEWVQACHVCVDGLGFVSVGGVRVRVCLMSLGTLRLRFGCAYLSCMSCVSVDPHCRSGTRTSQLV